ncbi:Calponin-homology (CH) domain-containing protein [Sergentomyia squamirostris]
MKLLVLLPVAGKREPCQEAEAQHWIETVLGERFPPGVLYEDVLRDGVILCRLMNRLKPGIIQRINTSGGDYKMMDNISQLDGVARQQKWQVDFICGMKMCEASKAIDLCTRTRDMTFPSTHSQRVLLCAWYYACCSACQIDVTDSTDNLRHVCVFHTCFPHSSPNPHIHTHLD